MRARCVTSAVAAAALLVSSYSAVQADNAQCSNPNALGTSRVISVDPTEHKRIGSMQYSETLPLKDKEVVLTFDDGPLPQYTSRVLEALARECVKATFFMVGRMAQAYPEWVRRVYNAGHTVATHTHSHVTRFRKLSYERAVIEAERGFAAVEGSLGDKRALAPFFRFPGLNNSSEMEAYLGHRGVMIWSADIPSDDWRPISADTVLSRSMTRLERKGRGVILMHDIQARTALVLPDLLRELKARGYRIVHVVPAGSARPKTLTEPEAWVSNRPRRPEWPVSVPPRRELAAALPVPSTLSFGFPYPLAEEITIESFDGQGLAMSVSRDGLAPRSSSRLAMAWPRSSTDAPLAESAPAMGPSEEKKAPLIPEPQLSVEEPRPAPVAAPVSAEQAAPEPKPAALLQEGTTQQRKVRPASPAKPDRRASREKPSATWARSLNWSYAQ